MTGKTHQSLGLTTATGWFLLYTSPAYSPATLAGVLVGAHLSALLPDIDQPMGGLWQKLPFGKILGKLSDPFLEHRNLTHSLVGFVAIGFGLYELLKIFPKYWGIDTNIVLAACMISYASHLVADMLTEEGIPLFFPYQAMIGIPPNPLQKWRMKTGKWFENLVVFPAVNLVLIILILTKLSVIKQIIFK